MVIETALDGMKKNQLSEQSPFNQKTYHLTSGRTVLNAMIGMHVHRLILLLGIREKVNTGELFSLL